MLRNRATPRFTRARWPNVGTSSMRPFRRVPCSGKLSFLAATNVERDHQSQWHASIANQAGRNSGTLCGESILLGRVISKYIYIDPEPFLTAVAAFLEFIEKRDDPASRIDCEAAGVFHAMTMDMTCLRLLILSDRSASSQQAYSCKYSTNQLHRTSTHSHRLKPLG